MTLVTDQSEEAVEEGTAQAHVRAALDGLAAVRTSTDWGWLEVSRPRRTAAFSRLDTLAAGYPEAVEVVRRHGFEPIIRPAGGRLAAYHQGALVLDVVGRHPSPSSDVEQRFRTFSDAVATALKTLGVDARVGPVPGEYCPGRFSVNAGGCTKLVGTAQRLTGGSFLLSAVVLVLDPEPVRAVLTEAYAALGWDWAPASVACVADYWPGATVDDVQDALVDALADRLPLEHPGAGRAGYGQRVALSSCWQPSSGQAS